VTWSSEPTYCLGKEKGRRIEEFDIVDGKRDRMLFLGSIALFQ
jgi:hypothetical protein